MKFEWDKQKNEMNLFKHGLRFADAWMLFDSPMLINLDERFNYSEDRWIAIGRLRARTVVCVYTESNGETIRIISLRKALSHERKAYKQLFGK